MDEPAHIPLIEDVWSNLLFGLRVGQHPHICATTTPLPTKWMKAIVADPTTRLVRASTYANIDNLLPTSPRSSSNATKTLASAGRRSTEKSLPTSRARSGSTRCSTATSASTSPHSTLTASSLGSTLPGQRAQVGRNRHCRRRVQGRALLRPRRPLRKYSPKWADRAKKAYDEYSADCVVVETNYGGDMVRATLENADVTMRIEEVTSRRGKVIRADPIVALYEAGRCSTSPTALASWRTSWCRGCPVPRPRPSRRPRPRHALRGEDCRTRIRGEPHGTTQHPLLRAQWPTRSNLAPVGSRQPVNQYILWAVAALVGIVASARFTRLIVADSLPPVVALRMWWAGLRR